MSEKATKDTHTGTHHVWLGFIRGGSQRHIVIMASDKASNLSRGWIEKMVKQSIDSDPFFKTYTSCG